MREQNSRDNGLYESLRQEVARIPAVDVHEHLRREEEWLAAHETDFASLLGYARIDLVSAGMPKGSLLPEAVAADPEEKWRRVRPFWPYVRNMGAGALCRRALAMFCGVDDLDDTTIPVIGGKLTSLAKPGIYRSLLKEQYNIDVCLATVPPFGPVVFSDCLAPLITTTPFAMIQKRSDIRWLENISHQGIYSLKTYVGAVDMVLDQGVKNGVVGMKWHTLAYLRDIDYPYEDEHVAERCLDRIFRMPAYGGPASDTAVGFDEMRPFQNFIQNHLVQRAIELDLPIQIHTGIQGGSYGGQITHAKPTHLVDLFLRYPQARFDILHGSYPYMQELAVLVKMFPNVYLNVAWLEVLSPRAAKQYVREWISSVPANKIFAFGADHSNPFLTCAYVELVRDNLAEILAAEVNEGTMSQSHALNTATWILRENPWQYYKLQDRWANRQ